MRESTLAKENRVVLRTVAIRGKHKIADRWSRTLSTVIRQIQDSPVFVVVPEGTDGPERVLHRDRLLPCRYLPPTVEETASKATRSKPANSPAVDLAGNDCSETGND